MLTSLLQSFWMLLQVQFALSSSSVFSKSDLATNSKHFYHSILEVLEDEEEQKDWKALRQWWKKWALLFSPKIGLTNLFSQVFPSSISHQCPNCQNSACVKIAKMRAKSCSSLACHMFFVKMKAPRRTHLYNLYLEYWWDSAALKSCNHWPRLATLPPLQASQASTTNCHVTKVGKVCSLLSGLLLILLCCLGIDFWTRCEFIFLDQKTSRLNDVSSSSCLQPGKILTIMSGTPWFSGPWAFPCSFYSCSTSRICFRARR